MIHVKGSKDFCRDFISLNQRNALISTVYSINPEYSMNSLMQELDVSSMVMVCISIFNYYQDLLLWIVLLKLFASHIMYTLKLMFKRENNWINENFEIRMKF